MSWFIPSKALDKSQKTAKDVFWVIFIIWFCTMVEKVVDRMNGAMLRSESILMLIQCIFRFEKRHNLILYRFSHGSWTPNKAGNKRTVRGSIWKHWKLNSKSNHWNTYYDLIHWLIKYQRSDIKHNTENWCTRAMLRHSYIVTAYHITEHTRLSN